jgi:YesN/AraC family two-component response regulator
VGRAEKGTEGLSVVEGESEISMVLTEVRMAIMEGLELLERLKELHFAMVVVLITGSMV